MPEDRGYVVQYRNPADVLLEIFLPASQSAQTRIAQLTALEESGRHIESVKCMHMLNWLMEECNL